METLWAMIGSRLRPTGLGAGRPRPLGRATDRSYVTGPARQAAWACTCLIEFGAVRLPRYGPSAATIGVTVLAAIVIALAIAVIGVGRRRR